MGTPESGVAAKDRYLPFPRVKVRVSTGWEVAVSRSPDLSIFRCVTRYVVQTFPYTRKTHMIASHKFVPPLVALLAVGSGFIDSGSAQFGSSVSTDRMEIRHLDTLVMDGVPLLDGNPIGGLSGIDYAPGSGYVAISDNRGESGPVRLYTLDLSIDGEKLGTPRFDREVDLLDVDGLPYARRSADTESVRWAPERNGFIYTSEGEAKVGRPGFIRQSDPDGSYVEDLPIPAAYTPSSGTNGTQVAGIRDNLGFESMTTGRGGNTVIAVSENALVQDGPAAGVGVESPARLVEIDRRTGNDLGEYIYPVDAVVPGGMPLATGVAEVVAVDDHTFLTLERSLITETGAFTGRIYKTSTASADNVAGSTVAPAGARRMSKELMFDFAAQGIDPQCVEGMTWGPSLPGGRRSLVLVSDDNFGLAGKTAFHLLSVTG